MSESGYRLYTDGGAAPNPGPGGWAFVLMTPQNERQEAFGGEADSTNNRMELTAVIRGFEAALAHATTEKPVIELVADSKYVLQGIEEWMAGWKARGWMKAGKPAKPVLNVMLWKELDALVSQLDLTCTWVRGHTGHVENERCDALVKDGIRSIGGTVE
jgi:ribonuclease HI